MLRKNPAGRDRASRTLCCDFTYASLTPRPMTVVFGLGTRLRVRMRTTLENGVLCNGQQPAIVSDLLEIFIILSFLDFVQCLMPVFLMHHF